MSVTGAALGTGIIVVGLHIPALVAAMLAVCALGIEWMLIRLASTSEPRSEQVAIGVAARAGNGLLILTLALLLLQAEGADERAIVNPRLRAGRVRGLVPGCRVAP